VQPDPPGDLAPASPIRLDTADVAGARRRLRLDWRTFVYLVAAMLAAFALIAVARGTSTMLTRIGVGLLIALALDPLTDSIQRRFGTRRSVAVAAVAMLVFGLATLIGVVLGPRAVDQAQQFSDELPETLAELERLPLIGDRLAEADVAARIEQWIERLPEHVTDARVAETAGSVISGLASVAIVAILAIAVLADGEQLVARFRRLLPPIRRDQADQVGRVMYRTLGRYFGGSVTVAMFMGLFVLAFGLILQIPLVPLAAVWAMLTDLIPQVGGFLGGSVFVMLALTQGVPTALIAGAGFVLYMNIENHVIQPAIVGRSVDLTPATTMVAAFVGAAVAGVPGALVATPLVGATKALYLEARGRTSPTATTGADEPDSCGWRERLRRLVRRARPSSG
jgi:predicted PurR-regulated permease PerM